MTDPLAEALSLLDVESARCTRLEAGGNWALHFPAKPAVKFAAVLRGRCWIVLPGQAPFLLEEGATFLLANAPAYDLANDLEMTPEDGLAAFDRGRSAFGRHGGDATVLIGGSFVFEAGGARLFLDALPAFLHIPAIAPAAALLRQTLLTLEAELVGEQVGKSLMTRRLADIALVQVLRAYVSEQGTASAGWMGAMADPRIGAALSLIHQNPGRGWTVGELGAAAGMSRSAFAVRFKDLVGLSPADYLLRWRMQRARNALRRGEASVHRIALEAGYRSASAFGNAFKRVFGRPPRRYAERSQIEWSEP